MAHPRAEAMGNMEKSAKPAARNEVVHARLPKELRDDLTDYASRTGMTMSAAVASLIEDGLNGRGENRGSADALARIEQRVAALEKQCGLAAKRVGQASQASLGTLALATWLAPDAMRFLANEALLRGQVLGKLLGNRDAALNVKVPASLGRCANGIEPGDLFAMLYSEVGGALSRDPRTGLVGAFARAVERNGLEGTGMLGLDEEGWRAARGGDAKGMSSLAARDAKARQHG